MNFYEVLTKHDRDAAEHEDLLLLQQVSRVRLRGPHRQHLSLVRPRNKNKSNGDFYTD